MKKFLAVLLSATMILTMSMTAFAASSPSSSSSSHHKSSSSGSSSSSVSASNKASSASSTASAAKAAADAAVQAKITPAQAVVGSDGQPKAASVAVASTSTATTAAFTTVAQAVGLTVSDTFTVNVTGVAPTEAVTMAFPATNFPASFALLVVDATGTLSIVSPVVLEGGVVALTLPANAQVAVVPLA